MTATDAHRSSNRAPALNFTMLPPMPVPVESHSARSARFDDLWASVAVITLLTLVLYNVVQIVENAVLAQLGMSNRLT